MFLRVAVLLAAVLVPTTAFGQAASDRVHPSGSQIFLRWDGFDAHRPAYEKTAVGKMMQGETGKFLGAVWDWLNDAADLAGQADPQAPVLIKEALKVVAGMGKHGLALSVEARNVNPPQGQVTLVFPQAAKEGTLLPLIRKAADLGRANVLESKVGKRSVQHIDLQVVHVGWWAEGDDAVMIIGTDDPAGYAKRIDANETGLADVPLYRQVTGFKEFPIWARGYIDTTALAKVGSGFSPEVSRLVEDLGLKNLKSVTFVSGFDGPAERSIVEIDMPGPRKGLLALAAGNKKISLADLPPLPDDTTSFSASNFNAGRIYDAGVQIVEAVARMFAPDFADQVKEGIKQFEGILGVKLGEDLFGSFDDMTVTYSSPAEGPLGLGGVYMFKVKDEKKLTQAVDSLLKAIPQIPGVNVETKKRTYEGVEITELHLNTPGNFNVPCWAVHKGWFVFASYPQSIYGYILRQKGDLPTWKSDAKLTAALGAFPKEFTGISVSDPRPTVKFLFSLLPPVITLGNSVTQFAPGLKQFDVGLVPHAQAATRHLFPNITVTTDDGKKIRVEQRASLALPF